MLFKNKKTTKEDLVKKSEGIASFITETINKFNETDEEIEQFNRELTDEIVSLEEQTKMKYSEREELRVLQENNLKVKSNLEGILGISSKRKSPKGE